MSRGRAAVLAPSGGALGLVVTAAGKARAVFLDEQGRETAVFPAGG